MTLRSLAISLALLAAFVSNSWGQSKETPPSKAKAESRAQAQPRTDEQDAAADQRGTEKFPLSVKMVGVEKTQPSADKSAKEDEKQPTDWWMFGVTAIVAFIALLQLFAFIAQARYMKRTVFEMRKTTHTTIRAARASIKSAGAIVAAERARFFVVIDQCNLAHLVGKFQNEGRLTPGENISISFRFKNYGKTPGILKERIIDSVIAEELPETLPLLLRVKDFPETMIGSMNETKLDWFGPAELPTTEQMGAVMRNTKRFWLYGRLYYNDVFGNPQVHCFYFRSKSNAAMNHCVLEPVEPKGHKEST
jgi:hypothetical protein